MKSQIRKHLENIYQLVCKTLINQLTILLTPAFSKEKMPALIPIRVVTRVSNHHR
jgi:hypothetical protein